MLLAKRRIEKRTNETSVSPFSFIGFKAVRKVFFDSCSLFSFTLVDFSTSKCYNLYTLTKYLKKRNCEKYLTISI